MGNEELKEVDRSSKPMPTKPRGRRFYYQPESESPKRQLERGELEKAQKRNKRN